ncbi:thiamine-phosphate pyrophosphorylase [Chitinophaga niastensis]|uniref:Thiamine-phosphate pyrophosphorylase n=1 Tax=Chitinophaga niastensis TaxID=536980 RepID=A0A2P8HT68_CHINA|nr:thiamine phosphate synthase [Chitinophaga niastensis]PSL49420.1 thiamine-phosphate pyrophosphorylase [Chitinophaga niastensis]
MIWIITSPERIHEEEKIIVELLQAGAARVLIRKPEWTMAQHTALLEKIDVAYYDRIIMRDNLWAQSRYSLAGVHWSWKSRALFTPDQLKQLLKQYPQNSTGVHSLEQIPEADNNFSTLLLSPVFNSISKPGYEGMFAQALKNKGNHNVLALGGVDHTNIGLLKRWQFDGAALLGTIWQTPLQAVENYYRIQELWNKSDLT